MEVCSTEELNKLAQYKVFHLSDSLGSGLIRRVCDNCFDAMVYISGENPKGFFGKEENIEINAAITVREATCEELFHFIDCWRANAYVAVPQEDIGSYIDKLRWRLQDAAIR